MNLMESNSLNINRNRKKSHKEIIKQKKLTTNYKSNSNFILNEGNILNEEIYKRKLVKKGNSSKNVLIQKNLSYKFDNKRKYSDNNVINFLKKLKKEIINENYKKEKSTLKSLQREAESISSSLKIKIKNLSNKNKNYLLKIVKFSKINLTNQIQIISKIFKIELFLQLEIIDKNNFQSFNPQVNNNELNDKTLNNTTDLMKNNKTVTKVNNNSNRILMTFNNIEDSFSEGETVVNKKIKSFIIGPRSSYILLWDSLILIVILYSIIFHPIFICFGLQHNFSYFIITTDFMFLLNVILNFFRKNIRKNPFNIYLILDILTSFPQDLIIVLNNINVEKLNSLIKLFYFLFLWIKTLRIIKLNFYISKGNLLGNFSIFKENRINRIINSSLFLILIVHLISCLFVFIGNCYLFGTNNWIDHNGFRDLANFEIYIAAYYYNLVTISTIGYGDISIKNNLEIIYTIMLLIFGVMTYTFFVSSISTLFEIKEKKILDYKEKLKLLNEIDSIYELPKDLLNKINQSLKIKLKHNKIEYLKLLESLPINIQNELIKIIFESKIKVMKFFQWTPNNFIFFVLPYMHPQKLIKGDILYSVGDFVEEMYFVVKGCLSLHLDKNYLDIEVGEIKENNHFGDLFLYFNGSTSYELKCKSTEADVIVLKKDDFIKIKSTYNEIILHNLNQSYKFFESLVKKKKFVEKINDFEKSGISLKKKIRTINNYILRKGFDNYFQNFKDFDNPYEIFKKNEFKNEIFKEFYHKSLRNSLSLNLNKSLRNRKSKEKISKKTSKKSLRDNFKIRKLNTPLSYYTKSINSEKIKDTNLKNLQKKSFHDNFEQNNSFGRNIFTCSARENRKEFEIYNDSEKKSFKSKFDSELNIRNLFNSYREKEFSKKTISKNEYKNKKIMTDTFKKIYKNLNSNAELIKEERKLEIKTLKLLAIDNGCNTRVSRSHSPNNKKAEINSREFSDYFNLNNQVEQIKWKKLQRISFENQLKVVLTSEFSIFNNRKESIDLKNKLNDKSIDDSIKFKTNLYSHANTIFEKNNFIKEKEKNKDFGKFYFNNLVINKFNNSESKIIKSNVDNQNKLDYIFYLLSNLK